MDTHAVRMRALSLVFLALVIPSLSASFSPCTAGQYRGKHSGLCEMCSKCPMNEIVRRPCAAARDTLCGPFYEFDSFNQGEAGEQNAQASDSDDFNLFKFESTKAPLLDSAGGAWVDHDAPGSGRVPVNGPYLKDDSWKWRELCYGLIVALAVLMVLFAVYVACTQVRLRKLNAKCKLSDAPDCREEPIYCYTQIFTSEEQPANGGKVKPHSVRNPMNKCSNAARKNSLKARAFPNDYVMHMRESHHTETLAEQNQLLPVIPEGSSMESDHVRVLSTNQK